MNECLILCTHHTTITTGHIWPAANGSNHTKDATVSTTLMLAETHLCKCGSGMLLPSVFSLPFQKSSLDGRKFI